MKTLQSADDIRGDFPLKEESYRVMGACFEVYKDKGYGFLEPVYQECLQYELADRGIPFVAQAPLELFYKQRPLKQRYQPDFICFEKILLEIKALSQLIDEHRAQILNYLHATGLQVGLLVNFGHSPGVEYERFANTRKPENRYLPGAAR